MITKIRIFCIFLCCLLMVSCGSSQNGSEASQGDGTGSGADIIPDPAPDPSPDTTKPTISISSPVNTGSYTTSSNTISISGSASDNIGVSQVIWTSDRGGSGTASGTNSWTIAGLSLQTGTNNIIVTAKDAAGNSSSDTLNVNYSNGVISLSGQVDSSLVNRKGKNSLYIYTGKVIPDDVGGANSNPISVVALNQNSDCTWNYEVPSLLAGEYTVAITGESDQDSPAQDDAITFLRTVQVMVRDGEVTTYNFPASNILRVGPTRLYKTVESVVSAVNDGDVIEIDAGVYTDDIVVWRQNNIVLRGVGGRAHMKATKEIPYTPGNDRENGMGIWVTKGRNTTVEHIEFSGSFVPDLNGAGIRANGPDLTVCDGYFHDNENGILGGEGNVIVEYSEFYNNGLGEFGRTHNMYISSASFTLRHSYSHHAHIGHNVKSRSSENYILYNRLMDEVDGDSSYAIDLPDGGLSYVIGNLIQQGAFGDNSTMLAYGAEQFRNSVKELYVINNTFVNDRGSGTFISTNSGTTVARVVNNIFVGGGTVVSGPGGDLSTNLISNSPGLQNRDAFDYHLTISSTEAINKGSDPGIGSNYDLNPRYHYVNSSQREIRPDDGKIDIGAYEFLP